MNSFPISEVVEFLKSQEWERCSNFSAEDIKSGNVGAIHQVYYNYLLEFNFSEDLILTDVANFDILQGVDHPEIFKDVMIPRLTIQAALAWFFRSISDEQTFGMKDLTKPDPERTLHFFSVLQNFWIFVSSLKEEDEVVETEVEKMVKTKGALQEAISKYKDEINRRKKEEVTEAREAEFYREKIDQVDASIEEKNREVLARKEECNKLMPIVAQLEELYNLAMQRNADLHKEKKSINVRQQLNIELEEAKSEQQDLEIKKSSLKRSQEDFQIIKNQYENIVSTAEAFMEEHNRLNAKGRMQSIQSETQDLARQEEEEARRIQDTEETVSNKKAGISTLQMKWNRKKEGKENEVRDLRSQVEVNTQSCSHSKLDMINRDREFEILIEDVKTEVKDLEDHHRSEYARLLNTMEKFKEDLEVKFTNLQME